MPKREIGHPDAETAAARVEELRRVLAQGPVPRSRRVRIAA
jgi:hypothetical protein